MSIIKPLLIPLFAALLVLLLAATGFVVVPACDEGDHGWGCESETTLAKGWIAQATNVGVSEAGDLHVDLAILNETGDWSAMQAVPARAVTLKASDGTTTSCDTVFVGTGGHYLAPGFQMRGYTDGAEAEPKTQLLYVECKGGTAAAGSTLDIVVSYVSGQYNYYDKTANTASAKLEVNLDDVDKNPQYPIVTSVEGLIQEAGDNIIGLNDVALTLVDAKRTEMGLEFAWQAFNPSDYPSALHVGPPPVIGADGILYGVYTDPGSVAAPLTSPGKTTEWTTIVSAPQEIKGFYALVSVETGTRLFTSYALDISDK
jgi:hypothetical protein